MADPAPLWPGAAMTRMDSVKTIAGRLRQYGLPHNSLAAGLAVVFTLALAIILLVTSIWVYWGLERRMNQEDREAVLRKLDTAAVLLRTHAADSEALRQEAYLPLPPNAPHNLYLSLTGGGKILLQTPGFRRAFASLPSFAATAGRPPLLRETTSDGRHFLVANLTLVARPRSGAPSEPLQLEVALDRSTEARILADYRVRLAWVLGIALLVSALAGYGIAWRGLRPLRRMADAASRIGANNLHQRLETAGLSAELRTLATAFNETLERLEGAFERISQFSADMAHELRTPISNLWGELEVALGRPRDAAQYREALESAVEECARLSQMIQSLLFLAQSEKPDGALLHEPLAVAEEVKKLVEFFDPVAGEARVQLSTETAPGLTLRADRVLLQRALGNLISNAIAYTSPGGQVTISAKVQNAFICIEVRDTGCGIAAEHQPHLFDRFYRVDPSRSRQRGGLGLGLALVRKIVLLHGGEVGVESVPSHGSRFWVRLPQKIHLID